MPQYTINNILAVSTSWASSAADDGAKLLQRLADLPIQGIELEYRMSGRIFAQLKSFLPNTHLKVFSIHNFFPAPPEKSGLKCGGDMLLLSDTDRQHREDAVKWTIHTLEHADELEAARVVLHCGYTKMQHESDILFDFYKSGQIASEKAQAFLAAKLAELGHRKPPHLDALRFSLDRLIPVAEKYGITLGLENRYHYHELPGPEDFATLFRDFHGAPLGYWHDCGHAHALECLGLIEPGMLLDRYAYALAGIHLHDAGGLGDHLPPGHGEVDFKRLAPFIKPDTPLVLELKPGTPDNDLKEGARHIIASLG